MMRDNSPIVLQRVVTLLYSNSLINPILYISINKQVRDAIKKMFTFHEQEWIRYGTYLDLSSSNLHFDEGCITVSSLFMVADKHRYII